jgi:hypothetical protein
MTPMQGALALWVWVPLALFAMYHVMNWMLDQWDR